MANPIESLSAIKRKGLIDQYTLCNYSYEYEEYAIKEYARNYDPYGFCNIQRQMVELTRDDNGRLLINPHPNVSFRQFLHRAVHYGVYPNYRFGLSRLAKMHTDITIKTPRDFSLGAFVLFFICYAYRLCSHS